jgi:peptidoglycan/xylan/chitin deacetylase (PgdA/CDA1 family)
MEIIMEKIMNKDFIKIKDFKNFRLLIIFFLILILIQRVEGLEPVTYSCCKDFSFDNGTSIDDFEAVSSYQIDNFEATATHQIDNFENSNNWTPGEGGIIQNDTINFIDGQQSLKLTTTNGNRSIIDKTINNNFADVLQFTIWIYVYDLSTFNENSLYISSTNNFSRYFYKSIQYLNQGWNKVVIDKNNFANYNNESWDNTMLKIRLALYPKNGDAEVSFDGLGSSTSPDWEVQVGSIEPDIQNYIEGQQGLKITTQDEISCYGGYGCAIADKTINNNLANFTDFQIWLYIEDISTFYQGSLYLTSTGSSWTKYFSISLQNLHQGWNNIILDKDNFRDNNGESWDNIMNKMRLITYSQPGTTSSATFDDYRFYTQYIWGTSAGITVPDTDNVRDGQQALKFVSINGSEVQADKTISANFKDVNNFAFWVYVDNASNLGFIRLILTSTGGAFSSSFYDSFGRYNYSQSVRDGWNEIVFNKHAFKNNFNEDWNNVMNRIRLDIAANPGKNVNVTVDNLRYNLTGQRAKLLIEFDDGLASTYSIAYPLLKANNQNATVFVVPSYVNDTLNGYATLNQIKTLQANGWDIGSHTYDHADLPTLNDVDLAFQLNAAYDWLINNKFQKAAGYIAYPFGTYSPHTLNFVENRYILGRTTQWESAMQHFNDDPSIWLTQRIITIEHSSSVDATPQFVKDNINDTINARLIATLVFHDIANKPLDIYSYSTADFTDVINYIKSRSADIDVIRQSDYVIPNINSFTPVINKTTRIFSNGTSILMTNNEYDEYMPNMTIKPSSGPMDILITSYNESGGQIKFNESIPDSNNTVTYNIGDRIPNMIYTKRNKISGVQCSCKY